MNFRRAASKLEYVRLSALALTFASAAMAVGCSHGRADARRLAVLLKVKPGMVVADIGAGNGATTLVMARRVGVNGHVFASGIDRQTLDRIRTTVKASGLDNITVVSPGKGYFGLPPDCCDAISMRRVYQALTNPAGYNASLIRALRPGGELAVLDFRPTIPWPFRSKGASANSRSDGIDPVIVVNEITGAGFEYVRMVDPWPGSWFISSYCLLFKKPPQGPAPVRRSPAAAPRASASPPAR
jgi:ubiquinone/menaquinone biosynthesis C-methylase UbiE